MDSVYIKYWSSRFPRTSECIADDLMTTLYKLDIINRREANYAYGLTETIRRNVNVVGSRELKNR